jgi:hypothetical protein
MGQVTGKKGGRERGGNGRWIGIGYGKREQEMLRELREGRTGGKGDTGMEDMGVGGVAGMSRRRDGG